LAPLTHRLTEAMPGFATTLAPVVERVAQMIASVSPYDVANPSVLTREKHKAAARRRVSWQPLEDSTPDGSGHRGPGVAGLSPRKKPRQKPLPQSEPALPLPICKACGAPLDRESDRVRRRGAYCPVCLSKRRSELGAELPGLARAAAASSSHTQTARNRRRKGNAVQRAEQAEWETENSGVVHDRAWFRSELLPKLEQLTLTSIARATGTSTSAASKIRSGQMMPHARHWQALAQLADEHRMDR
jgi:hypothetical protein